MWGGHPCNVGGDSKNHVFPANLEGTNVIISPPKKIIFAKNERFVPSKLGGDILLSPANLQAILVENREQTWRYMQNFVNLKILY